jgi:hypothetical protein
LNRISDLVRQIWKEERIPEEWKETIIVPIHKRGGKDKCEMHLLQYLVNKTHAKTVVQKHTGRQGKTNSPEDQN